ncbi:MAG: UDP-N-acetylmuramate dehydrogenase [Planctomycetes bacterium]|nr:UDP-N-acetylmuramate dehydrogenase [Planctomycetota bacterium]
MSIFSGLDETVEADYVLSRHTWYGLGGPADYFIRPQSTEQLSEVVTRCKDNGIKLYVIGFGSNLLISDQGVRGAVVKLESDFFNRTEFENDLVTAWAGADLKTLVLTSVEKGLAGLEMLTGIPGSVGGAVRMNTGGSFGDIGSVVESVLLMDGKGQVFEKSKPELSFDYRSSNITAKLVLNAKIRLTPGDPEQIMRTLQETWIYKKNHQPLNTRNCGCVFKNPRGQSAGTLIDRAGLKGLQVGGARVSDKHANFIVAQKDCTSVDVLRLIDAVRERVKEQSGVLLESEIEVWE